MKLYTISMSQWRKAKSMDVELVDITVKSGIKAFAPESALVRLYKEGGISEEHYTQLYEKRIRNELVERPEVFQVLLDKDTSIALACYCKAGTFCHRHLFIDILSEIADDNGYDIEHCGEIV